MKKPKLSKFPKMPKASASPEVWHRYEERCKVIEKRNEAKLKPYYSHIKEKEAVKARVLKMRDKRSMKSLKGGV